jgi:SAM-dependent methyltransferase
VTSIFHQFSLLVRRIVPRSFKRTIVRYTQWPPVGFADYGSLRRLTPISRDWGFSRGLPVDRYYIDQFLSTYGSDIKGCVLEVKDNSYTLRYGGDQVTKSDVLHKIDGNPGATIVADLAQGDNISTASFDCIICTQTLHFIYDIKAAIATLHRILKPGGVLLATIPGITQISRYDMEHWGDYWRVTTLSARLLFSERFPQDNLIIKAYGNVLAVASHLYGLSCEELEQQELDYFDPDYELLITIRAIKPG